MGQLVEVRALLSKPQAESAPLVEGLIRRGSKTLLFAPPKAGKSILALLVGVAVVEGGEFLGRRARAGGVLYIAGEAGLEEIGELLKAIRPNGWQEGQEAFWIWSMPEYALNSDRGREALRAVIRTVKESSGPPSLLVYDPAQFLMDGKMSDDERVRSFLRTLNMAQEETRDSGGQEAASLLLHHTHRTKYTDAGGKVDEEGVDYFGSQAWMAWCHTALRLHRGTDKSLTLTTVLYRTPIEFEEEKMTMVEEVPLALVRHVEGLDPTARTVLEGLKVLGEMTEKELRERCWPRRGKSHAMVTKGLGELEKRGLVKREGRPARWAWVKGVEEEGKKEE